MATNQAIPIQETILIQASDSFHFLPTLQDSTTPPADIRRFCPTPQDTTTPPAE